MSIIINAEKSTVRTSRSLSNAHNSILRNLANSQPSLIPGCRAKPPSVQTDGKELVRKSSDLKGQGDRHSYIAICRKLICDLDVNISRWITATGVHDTSQDNIRNYSVLLEEILPVVKSIVARFNDLQSTCIGRNPHVATYKSVATGSLFDKSDQFNQTTEQIKGLFVEISNISCANNSFAPVEILRKISLKIAMIHKSIAYLNYQMSVEHEMLSIQRKVNTESAISNRDNWQINGVKNIKSTTKSATFKSGVNLQPAIGRSTLHLTTAL